MKIRSTFRCAALTVALCAGVLSAQTNLYSNAQTTPNDPGLATGSVSASGVGAPPGFVWSETQAVSSTVANGVIGYSCHLMGSSGIYRFADDFAVPTNGSAAGTLVWTISQIDVYAYPMDDGGVPAPFEGLNLRIWNGAPDAPGSTVLFGDAATNHLFSAAATNILRIPSTTPLSNAPAPAAPDSTRRVWTLTAQISPALALPAGTYWLDWQIDGSGVSEAFCPPVTVAGQRAKPASNALQFRTAPPPSLVGQWLPLIDVGKPASAADAAQDLPFNLRGGALTPACGLADIAGQGGIPGQDGLLDNNDFVVFIDWFFTLNPGADRGVQGGLPGHDGLFDNNDFVIFIDQFFGGC